MLAREVITSAMNDIGNFFYKEADFHVNYELDCSGDSLAFVRLIFASPIMGFSEKFCKLEVNNIERMLYILFVVSHELAHFISLHHLHKDVEKLDSISIESRADIFGVQIALTLLSFGNSVQQLIQGISVPEVSFRINPENVINSILELESQIFAKNVSSNYPTNQYRVMSMIAACISFFSVYSKEHNLKLDLLFIRELILGRHLEKVPLISDHEITIDTINNRLEEIHKKLQWNNPMCIGGIKFEYGPYLTTNYILPNDISDKLKKHSQERYKKLFDEACEGKLEV